jgi:hypothetical protein
MADDRQPGGSVKVEYTRGGVPKQCPGCGHRFHPAGQCEHEWREYGVENPTEQRCLCDRNMAVRIPEPGGSGAGSTVELDLSDFAQHVVTSEWLAEVKAKFTRLQMDLTQSRATEAELRGKVERQPSVIRLAEDIIGGHSGHLPGASSSCPRCQWDAGLAALDVAEQPARAEGGQG